MKRYNKSVYPLLSAMVLSFMLSGCIPSSGGPAPKENALPAVMPKIQVEQILPRQMDDTEQGRMLRDGLNALNENSYADAGELFRGVLQKDPKNSYLHFLVALTYHLESLSGDKNQYNLAQLGYRYSLSLDPGNWMAAAQLGRLYYELRQFQISQEYIALALLLEPEEDILYHDLAAASYYAGDLATARGAVKELLKRYPSDPAVMRNSAVILAATGEAGSAGELLETLQGQKNGMGTGRLENALQRWQKLSQETENAKISVQLNQATDEVYDEPYEEKDISPLDKMALVEMVIIRSDEQLSSSKGGNLLQLLNISYNGVYESGDGDENSNTLNLQRQTDTDVLTNTVISDSISKSTSSSNTANDSSMLNQVVSIPMLTYNLNILNAGNSQTDILARPSLLVEEGREAAFSLVEEQMFTVRGQESGSLETVEAGIKLNITPEFLDDGLFRLDITGEASMFQPTSAVVGTFQEAVRLAKAQVRSSAVMMFDQTLVLSGFNQRAKIRSKDGVPLLQDVPGVQYLFSQEVQSSRQTSIMILLTPRRPAYATPGGDIIHRQVKGKSQLPHTPKVGYSHLEKLISSRKSVFDDHSVLKGPLTHLERSSEFYRKFRTGDIRLESWNTTPTFTQLVKQTVGFLYY